LLARGHLQTSSHGLLLPLSLFHLLLDECILEPSLTRVRSLVTELLLLVLLVVAQHSRGSFHKAVTRIPETAVNYVILSLRALIPRLLSAAGDPFE